MTKYKDYFMDVYGVVHKGIYRRDAVYRGYIVLACLPFIRQEFEVSFMHTNKEATCLTCLSL